MDERTGWSELASLLSGEASVRERVERFWDDPAGYFTEHELELFERGIDAPDAIRPVMVLVDALESVGELADADWKASVEDVVWLLGRLPLVAAAGVDLEPLEDTDEDAEVETVLSHVNALLAESDVTVVVVDQDSDSYPLVAVRPSSLQQLVEVEVAAGLGVQVDVPAPESP